MTLVPGAEGQSNILRDARTPLLLLAITAFVLLIACANIANLLLARSANRAKEFSMRLSLGASRGQLIVQLLTESVVLSVLAGFAGLFIAYATNQVVVALPSPDAGNFLSPALRPATIAFAFALPLVAGSLFGLFPAVHSTRQNVASAMKDQGANVCFSRSATRFRNSLVTAQIALSLLLFISTANTIDFGLSPELNQYSPERSRALFEQVEEKLAALPGVTGVAVSLVPLTAGNNFGSNVSIDGFKAGPDTDTHAMLHEVCPGCFRVLGVPLAAGRDFSARDGFNAPKVAIVNMAFVRKFSPSAPALGK